MRVYRQLELALALAAVIVALARPQTGITSENVLTEGIDIVMITGDHPLMAVGRGGGGEWVASPEAMQRKQSDKQTP